jgi:hypothetical protein
MNKSRFNVLLLTAFIALTIMAARDAHNTRSFPRAKSARISRLLPAREQLFYACQPEEPPHRTYV